MALELNRPPSKAPAMCKKHNPGFERLTCVFKVCLDGKKRQHPLDEGNQSAHTGTLEVHFGAALGLAGSNKMLSVLQHKKDQDGSAEGGAVRLGTIGYRAKANACPGLAAWT